MSGKKIKIVLLIVCILVFLVSVSFIMYNKYIEYGEQKVFKELENETETVTQEVIEETERNDTIKEIQGVGIEVEEEKETKTILPEYEKLYEENSDLYGWISIDGTLIDYPVMHTPDEPNYYIHNNWNKETSKSGTPFIDARTKSDTENVIIYGHNMKNRTMFGSLREYKEKSYFEEHKYIEFDTIYEKAKYEIISVSKAVIYYDEKAPEDEYLFYEHVELDTEEDFNKYIESAKENAYYDTGVTSEYGDSLITLCTCDYWTENARLIIVAKKI